MNRQTSETTMPTYLFIIEQAGRVEAGKPHPFSAEFRDAQVRALYDTTLPTYGQARRDFNAAFCSI